MKERMDQNWFQWVMQIKSNFHLPLPFPQQQLPLQLLCCFLNNELCWTDGIQTNVWAKKGIASSTYINAFCREMRLSERCWTSHFGDCCLCEKTTFILLYCVKVAVSMSHLPYWTKEIVGSFCNLTERLLVLQGSQISQFCGDFCFS